MTTTTNIINFFVAASIDSTQVEAVVELRHMLESTRKYVLILISIGV